MKKSFRSKLPALILLILTIIAAALYVLFFTDLPQKWGWKENEKVVGGCAGYDLTIDEVRYVTLLHRADFERRYGEGIWQDPAKTEQYREELEKTILRELKNNYAILACADHYLTKSEIEDKSLWDRVDEQMEALKSYYGDDLKAVLEAQNLTEDFLRFTLWVEEVRAILYDALDGKDGSFADVSTFYDWLRAGNCVYLQYVYLSNDPGEDSEENRALAETIRKELLSGTDIGTYLGSAINDDLSNVAPRFFVKGLCEDSLWEEIKDLTVPGQVSAVIATEKGYYVFLAMEEPAGLLEEKAGDLLTEDKTSRKSKIVESYRDQLTIEWNERGKALDFVTLN